MGLVSDFGAEKKGVCMRSVQWVSIVGLALGLVGCGAATSEITAELNSFQCRSSDFERLDAAVTKIRKTGDYASSDSHVYALFETFNAKLASKCSAPVLAKCSPTAQKVVSGDSIVGPINSLGVRGHTDFKTVYRHDGFARGPVPVLIYSVSVSGKAFREGLACFSQHAP